VAVRNCSTPFGYFAVNHTGNKVLLCASRGAQSPRCQHVITVYRNERDSASIHRPTVKTCPCLFINTAYSSKAVFRLRFVWSLVNTSNLPLSVGVQVKPKLTWPQIGRFLNLPCKRVALLLHSSKYFLNHFHPSAAVSKRTEDSPFTQPWPLQWGSSAHAGQCWYSTSHDVMTDSFHNLPNSLINPLKTKINLDVFKD
jgi:hypothetical protein